MAEDTDEDEDGDGEVGRGSCSLEMQEEEDTTAEGGSETSGQTRESELGTGVGLSELMLGN